METEATTWNARVTEANTYNTATARGTVGTTSKRLRPHRLLRLARLAAALGLLLTLLISGTPALAAPAPDWIPIPVSNVADVDEGPDGSIWVVKRDGTIHYSVNGGTNFAQIQASGFGRIAVAKLFGSMGEVVVWAVGSNGTVWKYTKGSFGATWQRMMQFGIDTAQDVATGPNGSIWVVGTLGSIHYSNNGGASFARVQVPGAGFRRISVSSVNGIITVWALDVNGGLSKFANNQWTPQKPNGMEDVAAISNGSTVFLTSFNGSVWLWSYSDFLVGGSGFQSIAAAKSSNENHYDAWAVGRNGTLWRLRYYPNLLN